MFEGFGSYGALVRKMGVVLAFAFMVAFPLQFAQADEGVSYPDVVTQDDAAVVVDATSARDGDANGQLDVNSLGSAMTKGGSYKPGLVTGLSCPPLAWYVCVFDEEASNPSNGLQQAILPQQLLNFGFID